MVLLPKLYSYKYKITRLKTYTKNDVVTKRIGWVKQIVLRKNKIGISIVQTKLYRMRLIAE